MASFGSSSMAFLKQAMASSNWPLRIQRNAQVGVGHGELRVEFDGLLVAGDGLVQLALVLQRMPRLLWASAYFGSSSMAFL